MMKTICKLCRGAKKTRGLGCMVRECLECAGKGYIPVEKIKADLIQALKEEKIVEPIKDDAKHERETEAKTVAETKRKYVRKDKETPAQHGVCDVA